MPNHISNLSKTPLPSVMSLDNSPDLRGPDPGRAAGGDRAVPEGSGQDGAGAGRLARPGRRREDPLQHAGAGGGGRDAETGAQGRGHNGHRGEHGRSVVLR